MNSIINSLDTWLAADNEKKSGRGRSAGNAASVYGIRKLRELILELAVRGKLVPQDLNDEPASELLKRIKAEKEKLVKAGKIKKEKPLAEITEEEKPFELPVGWEWVRLGQSLLKITDGTHHSPPNLDDGAYKYISAKNIKYWGIDLSDVTYVTKEIHEEIYSRCDPAFGDILYIKDGATTGIATINTIREPFSMLSSVALLRPSSGTNNEYLLKAMTAPFFYAEMRSEMTGVAITRVTLAKLNNAIIPLPPLAEQHRIVAKVDELMALCDQLETKHNNATEAHEQLVSALLQSLTQSADASEFADNWHRIATHFDTLFTTEASIDALKQTLLQLAVMGKLVPQDPNDEPASELLKKIRAEKDGLITEGVIRKQKEMLPDGLQESPYEVPHGWIWQHMDDLFLITGGVTLGRKLTGQKLVSRPYLRVANVQRGSLDLDHIKEIEVPESEVEKYSLKQGDLLITEGGDWDKVGRTAVWNGELAECLHQNHIFRVRPLVSEWESRWSEMYLNSGAAREYFAGSSKQTTNLASINMTQLRGCAFALPPLAEQHRIVAKVDELMALCDQLKARMIDAAEMQRKLADGVVAAVN
jgi:type I restriction enzyme S subunit